MEAKVRLAAMHVDPDKRKEDQKDAIRSMETQERVEEFRDKISPKRISNFARRTAVQPIQRGLTAISTKVGTGIDEAEMSLTDKFVGTGEGAQAALDAHDSAIASGAALTAAGGLPTTSRTRLTSAGIPAGISVPMTDTDMHATEQALTEIRRSSSEKNKMVQSMGIEAAKPSATSTTTPTTSLSTDASGLSGITSETLSQMQNMSTQLVKNMEVLITLQKRFNQLQGSR